MKKKKMLVVILFVLITIQPNVFTAYGETMLTPDCEKNCKMMQREIRTIQF